MIYMYAPGEFSAHHDDTVLPIEELDTFTVPTLN
jgi:hypothetical protein